MASDKPPARQGRRARAPAPATRRTATAAKPAPLVAGRQGRATLAARLSSAHQAQLLGLIPIVLFAALLHLSVMPLVADNDSFYHIRHAWVYRTRGIFDSAFPWTQYSAVRTYAADIWYGFHILLVPLTLLNTLLDGLYCGAFLVTVGALWLAFLAFCRLRVRWPLFWTFFLPLIAADLLYRLTMLRPHALTLGLAMLLFAYLVTQPTRRSELAIFLIAAAAAWIHIALIWLPVLLAAVVSVVRLLFREMPEWRKLGAFSAGLALGIVLRPHPAGALHLAYIQVVQFMAAKHLPLRFGRELFPFFGVHFLDQFMPISVLLLLAIGILFVLARRKRWSAIDLGSRVAIVASLAVATLFFVLTFTVARRSHEEFIGFAAIFLALIFHQWRPAVREAGAKLVILTALVALLCAPVAAIYRFSTYQLFNPLEFQAVGEWLAQHAQPGEIVFHPQWDRFAELFFWNPSNYYINGMDPIFEYAYDPHFYWKTHYLANDGTDAYTCGDFPCTDDQVIATHESLQEDFHAAYVVLEKGRNPRLNTYLSTATGFENVFESPTQVVYKVGS